MNLETVPEQGNTYIAFGGFVHGLCAGNIRYTPSVFQAIQEAGKIGRDDLVRMLQGGNPPNVMPMPQKDLYVGPDADWVMHYELGGGRIIVLAEIVLAWQYNQKNEFLTRQLTSIVGMGLVNYIKDKKNTLRLGDSNVYFGTIPYHQKDWTRKAFGPLGWSEDQYLPDRQAFADNGFPIPVPNQNATHP
jgi:hypothetical protein